MRFASRASFERASHATPTRKTAKVCALTPRETTDSRLARLGMPSTRHYLNRQILCSTSEKLKRILLGLLDRPDAAERPNHTRRAISRAKTTVAAPWMSSETRPLCLLPLQSMLPDCLPSSRAGTGRRGRPEIAIDAVESLALVPSGDRAARATGKSQSIPFVPDYLPSSAEG